MGIYCCGSKIETNEISQLASHNDAEDALGCALLNLSMRDKGIGSQEAALKLHPELAKDVNALNQLARAEANEGTYDRVPDDFKTGV